MIDKVPEYPDCPHHKEVQHRDGKPPWCNTCGWNRGHSAVPASYVSTPRVKGVISDAPMTKRPFDFEI